MSRRTLWTTVAIGTLALTMSLAAGAADNQLVLASWGGIFKDATQKNIAEPFSKETGAKVEIADVGGGWAAKIDAQKAAGRVQWDLIDSIDAGSAQYLAEKGLLEPIPAALKAKLEAVSIPARSRNTGSRRGAPVW